MRKRWWWRVRRPGLVSALRSLLVTSGLVAAYYLLPMDRSFSAGTVLTLLGGLVGVTLMLAWQARGIASSPHPRLQAVETLAVIAPAFLLLFATTYFLLARTDPGYFSEPLTRTDALYFTVTVFSTVGFGDITPRTETARLLVTVQMISDLLLIGVAARALVGAVQEGVRRSHETPPAPEPGAD